MPNSLRTKLSKLRYEGNITDTEYKELIDKLDRQINELYEKYPELKEGEENEQNDSI